MFKKKDKGFFSFEDINKKINEIINIKPEDQFFSKSLTIRNFKTEFELNNSMYSHYINGGDENNDFKVLGLFSSKLIQNNSLYKRIF